MRLPVERAGRDVVAWLLPVEVDGMLLRVTVEAEACSPWVREELSL